MGTVADQFQLFPIGAPAISDVWLIQSVSLDDPDLGSASAFYFFPGFVNTYISEDAGIQDIVNFFGQSFTLFDVPSSATSAAAGAASELGDGFQQLLTEFTSAFPGVDIS